MITLDLDITQSLTDAFTGVQIAVNKTPQFAQVVQETELEFQLVDVLKVKMNF